MLPGFSVKEGAPSISENRIFEAWNQAPNKRGPLLLGKYDIAAVRHKIKKIQHFLHIFKLK
jgi:hypothetical protein